MTPGPGHGKEFCLQAWSFYRSLTSLAPVLEGLAVCVSSVGTVAVGVCHPRGALGGGGGGGGGTRTEVPCILVAALQVRGLQTLGC